MFFILVVGLLMAGWFIAKRVVASYVLRTQKQREFDSGNAQQFYTAYSDFFAIWKLWNYYLERSENELPDHGEYEIPHASPLGFADTGDTWRKGFWTRYSSNCPRRTGWIRRATSSCSGVSARRSNRSARRSKTNKPLNWKDPEHPDYLVFKRLASCIALLIGGEKFRTINPLDQHSDAFRQVTSGRWDRAWNSREHAGAPVRRK